jgi:hypothetical protein
VSVPLASAAGRVLTAGRGRIAAAWATAALAALLALGGGPGISRDEAAVIAAAQGAPAVATPPLASALARAGGLAAGAGVPPLRALRLGGALLGALLAALLAIAAREIAGPAGAALAPALFWLAPRHLHAALVATPDLALAALSLATVLAWRRAVAASGRARTLRAAAFAGVLLGGAVAARADAWVLLPALAVHAAYLGVLRRREATSAPGPGLAALAALAVLAAAVVLALWPEVLRAGLAPWLPPRAGALSTLRVALLTVPATLLVAFAGGAVHAASRAARALVPASNDVARAAPRGREHGGRPFASASDDALLLLAAAASIAGSTLAAAPPGARPALHAVPFLALLGARALLHAASIAWPRRAAPLAGAVALLVLYPALRATVRAFPQGTSAWSELAGGAPGAASRGLPRQDGGDAVVAAIEIVNARARAGARVWWPSAATEAIALYARDGRLRRDLVPASGPEDADLAVVALDAGNRDAEYRAWAAFRTARPAAGVYVDEVPIAFVYARTGAWR